MKKLMALVMTVVMLIACTACSGGIDISKIKGDWTISTVNGTDTEEYFASQGITDPAQAHGNVTINDDGTLIVTNNAGSLTYNYEKRANGVEVKQDGKLILSFAYDSSADTLTYAVTDGTNTNTFVYVKGAYDFAAAAEGAGDEAVVDDETADDEAVVDDETADDEAVVDGETADDEAVVDDEEAADDEAAE